MKKLLITGIGSGLGEALARFYLEKGCEVYALGRRIPRDLEATAALHFVQCDLRRLEYTQGAVRDLVGNAGELDLVLLNAGILGEIKDMTDTALYEIEAVMTVNVWANKVLLDTLIDLDTTVAQVVGISSGAAVNCNRGWNAYSLSKAALNTLLKLYAREMEATHITSLAPGIIWTPMLKRVIDETDKLRYPSVQRIDDAAKMTPEEAARLLDATFPRLKRYESGSFLDVRTL